MCNSSGGREACMKTVSNSIQRNVSIVAGPSVLREASGIQRSLCRLIRGQPKQSLVGETGSLQEVDASSKKEFMRDDPL